MAREKLGGFALTEPDFGSILAACIAAPSKTSHGYRLNGAKKWIGNGTIADIAIVWAKVEGEEEIDPNSTKAVRGFLVEKGTPGFNAALIEGKLSLRVGLTAELEFKDCAIPASALRFPDGAAGHALAAHVPRNHARYGHRLGRDRARPWPATTKRGKMREKPRCNSIAPSAASNSCKPSSPACSPRSLVKRNVARPPSPAQLKDAGAAQHCHISMAKMNNVEIAARCRPHRATSWAASAFSISTSFSGTFANSIE